VSEASRELQNRDLVIAELDVLRARLRGADVEDAVARLAERRSSFDGRSTLDDVAAGFGLTEFERAIVLMAAGPDLVAAVGDELVDRTNSGRPTFGLALALVPDAHWSALAPLGPLRWWELVRLLDPTAVTSSALVVDERILHQIAGVGQLDAGLSSISQRLDVLAWMPPTLGVLADSVVEAWQRGGLAFVHGPQQGNIRGVLAAAADSVGLVVREVAAADLPTTAHERARILRRMERETVLAGCAWAINVADSTTDESAGLVRGLAAADAPFALVSTTADGHLSPDTASITVPRLAVAERREAYASALRRHGVEIDRALVDSASGVFDLPIETIDLVARDVSDAVPLWHACRVRQRPALGALAAVRTPRATWDDLVLPLPQLEQLHALVAAVRHRAKVLDEWGFARHRDRGLGSTALFSGPSGTGKTLAAEVIATDLDLDLVHVDLSQVVSKYIGETEKQLRRLFDAAEDGGVVLLFDEADTLFGKRSEVRDSHDRYANLEVGYLLQRIESFDGLAILTTNARSALDQAFTRRLSTIVSFPYPDRRAREAMWRRAFPDDAPLDVVAASELAVADLAGGGIAAAALQASYLAASDGTPIRTHHIETATRWELAKSGRSTTFRREVRRSPRHADVDGVT
jgi:hypothetical protein